MNHIKTIKKVINNRAIVNMATLRSALDGRSRCSVFRDLSKLAHISSFTHAGEYFTLPNIPKFDANGFWFSGDIGFSIHGTLKNTLIHTVNSAEAGHTHEELESMCRVRVHNVLLELVHLNKITRELLSEDKIYLYLSSDNRLRCRQLEKRQSSDRQAATIKKSLTPMITVQVLVEVIRDRAVQVSAEEIQKRLNHQGVDIRLELVKYIFSRYEIGVKKTPPSR